jgi:sterol desaturase/sphingolipid hydroxylase (fatty acid hydroxylase superfamily)
MIVINQSLHFSSINQTIYSLFYTILTQLFSLREHKKRVSIRFIKYNFFIQDPRFNNKKVHFIKIRTIFIIVIVLICVAVIYLFDLKLHIASFNLFARSVHKYVYFKKKKTYGIFKVIFF